MLIRVLEYLYYEGLQGFVPDPEKTVELWRRSADLEDAAVCSLLGCALEEGKATVMNIKEDKHYYKLGATRGHIVAHFILG